MPREQNELLTRTGAGTLMGDLFRRYWIPALLAEELAEPDGPPVRVQLLGESLVAFRDTQGRLGLIEEFCAHRGVSLWFGRNEECGLRCPYHGWKYDVTGQCVDLPSEPDRDRHARAHQAEDPIPCLERGRRDLDLHGAARAEARAAGARMGAGRAASGATSPSACRSRNYLQAIEGGIDSSHVSFLHSGALEPRSALRRQPGRTSTTCATACRTSRWWSTTAAS